MDEVKTNNAHRFPARSAKARATRVKMLDSARDLFIEQGYGSTTIEAIAKRAGVSPQNLYFAFGNKRSILSEALNVASVGDDEPVPVLERAWVNEAKAEPDPGRQIDRHVRAAREIYERVAPLFDVVRSAAATDPELAEQWKLNQRQRWEVQEFLVSVLAAKGGLRKGITASRAGDIVVSLMSPELYLLLVNERGWTPSQWERWVATSLRTQLLRD